MEINKVTRNYLDFIGRILLSMVFINSIPIKITRFSSVTSYIVEKGIPEPISSVLLVFSIIFLTLGSIFIIFPINLKNRTQIGSLLLITFLIPTTIIFHVSPLDLRSVLLNLGLIGGLIILFLSNDRNDEL